MKTFLCMGFVAAAAITSANADVVEEQCPVNSVVPAPALLTQVRSEIFEPVVKGKVASLALIVLRDGEVIWEETAGWADREERKAATSSTIYPVASVTKAFTATAVMKLVEEGRLSFFDRAEEMKLLASHTTDPTITIHDLLSMRGGVPHMWLYRYEGRENILGQPWGRIPSYAAAAMPAGGHHYSNLSADLAGRAAGRVLGVSYPEAMNELLFHPLQMTDSGVGLEFRQQSAVAVGYDRRGNRLDPTHLEPDGGAGGYSSTRDLAKFAQLHLGKNPHLSAETLSSLHAPPPDNEGYMGGWAHVEYANEKICLISNGVGLGAVASIWILPQERIAVVAASNSNGADTDGAAVRMLDGMQPGFASRFAELVAAAEEKNRPIPLAEDARILGDWVGQLRVGDELTTVTLNVDAAGTAILQIDDGLKLLVNGAHWEEQTLLRGTVPGPLPIDELRSFPHTVDIQLRFADSKLRGVLRATSDEARPHFGLPFPLTLTKRTES